MEKLKRCPFCGGDAEFITATNSQQGAKRGFGFGIRCTKCEVQLPRKNYVLEFRIAGDGSLMTLVDQRKKAAEDWNSRASGSAV